MSLRAFHLFFISLSVMLTAFFAAWAFGQYRSAHDTSYALVAVASLASGVGLAIYGAAFQRKTRGLS
jgi:ABC-type Mn2+/Zn2+ transport system permease subunit